MKISVDGTTTESFVKRAMYLAYQKSQVLGMGMLQDRNELDEEAFWKHAIGANDYPGDFKEGQAGSDGEVYCDYVCGRMMKVGADWTPDEANFPGEKYDPAYESFCVVYPTPKDLLDATAESLGCSYNNVVEADKPTV